MKGKSIVTANWDNCFVCGRRGELEEHHCMHGTSNRKLAEKYNLTVPLCHSCHRELHDRNTELDKRIMQLTQIEFEKNFSYELWMQVFKKNYR